MKFTSEKVNELLGVDEAFKVPNKLRIDMNEWHKKFTDDMLKNDLRKFLEVE
ncbi:hypothetical protein [Leuconostoc mesenteroides]|uniref:hypothetical protein n=1 Tax=Leuconostoc mesenteroides TaxID=1245 RepID=UPI000AE492A1|nr:hypothetical protein [Leuconostoc mesenteroides]